MGWPSLCVNVCVCLLSCMWMHDCIMYNKVNWRQIKSLSGKCTMLFFKWKNETSTLCVCLHLMDFWVAIIIEPNIWAVKEIKDFSRKCQHQLFLLLFQAVHSRGQHSISFTLSRNQTVVVEYCHDNNTDMFQVTHQGNQLFHTPALSKGLFYNNNNNKKNPRFLITSNFLLKFAVM